MRMLGSAAADKQEALLLLLSEILTTGAAAGRASDQLKRSNVVAPPTVGVAPLLLLGVIPFATEDMITASTCTCFFFFSFSYVLFSLCFFFSSVLSRLFSSLLLEECVFESASQEKALDNSLLQGQGKCGFLSLPWGDHFFSSGYLWNHKLYRLLPIFKCGKTKRPTAAEAGKKFCAGDETQTACLLLGRGLATTQQQQQQQEKRTKRQLQQSKSKPSSSPLCASPGHSTLPFHNIPTSATLCMRKISVILSSEIDANLPT
jgi:hypothetical protein